MATEKAAARARIQKVYEDVGEPCMSAAQYALTKVFIDYKAWDVIPDEGDIAVVELAKKIGGTEEVIRRMTTFFVARKVLDSPAPGRIAHTEQSRTYKSDQPTAWMWIHMFNNVFCAFSQVSVFFERYGLASPESVDFTPLGLSHGHDSKPAYEIITDDKTHHKGFNEALRGIGEMYSLKGIYDFGWMHDALTDGSRIAIVDIGGSHGYALRDVLRNNTFIPAKTCVLYDLPGVIENTKRNLEKNPGELQNIQLVGGNMFEAYPEPIQGACIYQFRRVLNDFPDQDVVRAFQSVRNAVAPDSRILIIEDMLSPKPIALQAGLDIALMMTAGKRRNAEMFSELAAKAGFRLNAEFKDINSRFDDFGVLEFMLE
jgi:hypothetical protein